MPKISEPANQQQAENVLLTVLIKLLLTLTPALFNYYLPTTACVRIQIKGNIEKQSFRSQGTAESDVHSSACVLRSPAAAGKI